MTSWFQGQTLAEASGFESGRFMREGSIAYHSEEREKKAAKSPSELSKEATGLVAAACSGANRTSSKAPNAKSSSPISRCSLHQSWAMKRFSRYMRPFPSAVSWNGTHFLRHEVSRTKHAEWDCPMSRDDPMEVCCSLLRPPRYGISRQSLTTHDSVLRPRQTCLASSWGGGRRDVARTGHRP